MTTTNAPPATPVPVSGNWAFGVSLTGSATTPAAIPPLLAGSLTVSGTQIAADFLAVPTFLTTSTTNCAPPTTPDVTLTGTVQNAQVSLTSAAWSGTILTVTGTVSSSGHSITGSWSAKGGCIDGQSGPYLANYVPPVTGTWTGTTSNLPAGLSGTATSTPLAGATLTLDLQQSSTPTQYYFPLSGTVTISGASCGFTHGTLVQSAGGVVPQPSLVVGNTWLLEAQMDDGKSTVAMAAAPLQTSSAQWLTVVTAVGGTCNGVIAQATLIQQ